jgi:hypothetical protein
MDMRMRFTGFPETEGSAQGEVRMTGAFDMEVTTLDAG